jgi:preprotein translocase subunit SecE
MSQPQTAKEVSSSKWGVWLSVVIIVASFLAYFYVLKSGSKSLPAAVLAGGFLFAGVVFFVSPTGKWFVSFAAESYREARKVVWPERNDVFKLTGVVSVFVLIMAFFMWGVDKVLEAILKLLTGV